MSRTIEKTVYQYSELSEEAKEKARNWYKEGATDYDWHEFIFDDEKEAGKILGINIDKIYFSGFSCQGDGACFEGSYGYAKQAVKNIKGYAPQDTELHSIAKELQDIQRKQFYKLYATCKHRGHYYHSDCMSVDVENYDDPYKDIGSAEDEIRDVLRSFADWIYNQLETEYNCLMSDEQIEEAIKANGYEFDESGKII